MNKSELKRLIVVRLNFMHITEERDLPEFGGVIIRQPHNIVEWLLPKERFSFGGAGSTWEQARLELVDGIWNRLHGKPVTTKEMCVCEHCGRAFIPILRRVTRFCNQDCRNARWHVRYAEKRREKSNTTDSQHG